MKYVRIVSKIKDINSFYCKNCKVGHSILYKNDEESYCESCVPKEFKAKCKTINQNREEINV